MKKLFLLGALIFSLGFGASVASAQTDAVQNSCVKLTYDLSLNSTDSSTKGEVSKLQSFLKSTKYSGQEASGKFDDLTKVSVMIFQADNKITPVSGVVGEKTRAKIYEESCNPIVKPLTFLQMLFGNLQTGPISLEDLLAKYKGTKPVPTVPVPTTQPSIEIVAKSGTTLSTYYIVVEKGQKIEFYGKPANLSDVDYSENGFTAAWKSTNSVFDEKCLNKNNKKFNGNSVWRTTCKAVKTGDAEVYVEIYKDGETYTSNKINVVVEERSAHKKSKIKLDYAMSAGLEKNTISVDQTATIYGKNLADKNMSVHLKGKSVKHADTKLEVINVQAASADFIVPELASGEYELWIEQSGNKASNKLIVKVIKGDVSITTDFKFIFPTTNSKLIAGQTYIITWAGMEPGAETYNFFLDCEDPSCDAVLIGTAVAEKTPMLSWTVADNTKPRSDYFISYNAVGKNVRSYFVAPRGPSFTISR